MIKFKRLLNINLRLFEGEGAPAAGADSAGAAESGNSASLGKKQGEKVVYGKQPDSAAKPDQVADGQKPGNAPDPEARKQEFEKYISDNKDLFSDKVQGIIDKRFKETKNLEKWQGDAKPILDVMMNKYGIADGDINSLVKAIEADDAYWEELADKEGLTVEQYKHKQKLEAENRILKQKQDAIDAQTESQKIYNGWLEQEAKIKGEYPTFDLKTETANPDFVAMISRGVDLKAAYEVIHLDDIKSGVAKKAETNIANTIRATGQRPAENGTSSQSGVIVKSDPSKLTKADREEIARRAMRGENIQF